MAVFITGDIHGNNSINKLSSKHFDSTGLTRDDYVIILGDFGLVWSDPMSTDEAYWLDEPCWTIVDFQGATMPDVWPESEGLKDGDEFIALVDTDDRIWFQTTIRQAEDGEWFLEGTPFKGDLTGIYVRQTSTITFEEFKKRKEEQEGK